MRIVALEYHDVVENEAWESSGFGGNSAASYKMDRERFGAHLDAVASVPNEICNDIRALPSAPVSLASPSSRALPSAPMIASARVVLFTFDDGGASALHPIADQLEAHGWRGHFLMTTGQIGAPGFLAASDLVELHRRGHVIGSHTENHPARMSLVPPRQQVLEWSQSRERLESILGEPVQVASVPGGYFDRQAAECAAEAGIRWLFTSEPESLVAQVAGCAIIGRFTLRRQSAAAVARALVCANPRARASQWLQWNAKKLAKRLAGDSYLRLRATLFRERLP